MRFLKRQWRRWQSAQQTLSEVEILVLDLELTGLDPRQHEIVSAAWVPIKAGRIQLGGAEHWLNRDVKQLAQSPVYHGVSHAHLAAGCALEEFVEALRRAVHNRIVLCHHAHLDLSFIRNLLRSQQCIAEPRLVLDSMWLERRRLLQQGKEIGQDDLTLAACRARYQLPPYQEHHALSDALATAELFLAQTVTMGSADSLRLAKLL
ncbi:exonuclease domain-containing protein [Pseudoalteromonas fenneropenaei]|uniref:Exonuclease domain-containing protein n=1 Tax=Pseudoalteromonas fenneropenaei TaxID=1737459 RepID=A0ABV7CNI5_9GAMM